jgi:hypothetical protein
VALKADRYRPKIYGFQVHEIVNLQRWQLGGCSGSPGCEVGGVGGDKENVICFFVPFWAFISLVVFSYSLLNTVLLLVIVPSHPPSVRDGAPRSSRADERHDEPFKDSC